MESSTRKTGLIDRGRALIRFLINRPIYLLVLSSALACALFYGRVVLSHSRTYYFMVWNLFLAWIPYAWSLAAAGLHRRFPSRWWPLLIPGALWLIFFPNAPYLVTDFLHLHQRPLVPLGYDLIFFAAFAVAGVLLAISSLQVMQSIIKDLAGRTISWLFVVITIGLTGLGVYLGRFLQLNSWDLFLYPQEVINTIGHLLAHPLSHLEMYGFTVAFAAFLFACYWIFTSIQQHKITTVSDSSGRYIAK